MSAAYVTVSGEIAQLDGRAPPPFIVTAQDVQDPEKLARLLEQALRENQELKRRWNPRRMFFRDIAVDNTGGVEFRLQHGFNGRVNWYVAKWRGNGAPFAELHDSANSDENTLILLSFETGTATVLVEEAG